MTAPQVWIGPRVRVVADPVRVGEWTARAACRGLGVADRFFGPDWEIQSARALREADARAICAGCSVRPDCLAHALEEGESDGVWGGLNPDERKTLRRPPASEGSNAPHPPPDGLAAPEGLPVPDPAPEALLALRLTAGRGVAA